MPRPGWSDDLDVLDAIELALTPDERAMLHAQLDAMGIDRDGWLDIPSLRQSFAMFAVSNLARGFIAAGRSKDTARKQAAHRLGIPEPTVRHWLDRGWAVREF